MNKVLVCCLCFFNLVSILGFESIEAMTKEVSKVQSSSRSISAVRTHLHRSESQPADQNTSSCTMARNRSVTLLSNRSTSAVRTHLHRSESQPADQNTSSFTRTQNRSVALLSNRSTSAVRTHLHRSESQPADQNTSSCTMARNRSVALPSNRSTSAVRMPLYESAVQPSTQNTSSITVQYTQASRKAATPHFLHPQNQNPLDNIFRGYKAVDSGPEVTPDYVLKKIEEYVNITPENRSRENFRTKYYGFFVQIINDAFRENATIPAGTTIYIEHCDISDKLAELYVLLNRIPDFQRIIITEDSLPADLRDGSKARCFTKRDLRQYLSKQNNNQ